jgi:hypothetical protein
MLNEAGIPAYYALIPTHDVGNLVRDFPHPFQFDHCIKESLEWLVSDLCPGARLIEYRYTDPLDFQTDLAEYLKATAPDYCKRVGDMLIFRVGVRLILRSKLGKMMVNEERPELFPAIA